MAHALAPAARVDVARAVHLLAVAVPLALVPVARVRGAVALLQRAPAMTDASLKLAIVRGTVGVFDIGLAVAAVWKSLEEGGERRRFEMGGWEVWRGGAAAF